MIETVSLSLVTTPRATGLRHDSVAFIRYKITKNELGADLSRSNRLKPGS